MAKRTGLGRGIGALIPTSEGTQSRPVDVFFPDAQRTDVETSAPARTRKPVEKPATSTTPKRETKAAASATKPATRATKTTTARRSASGGSAQPTATAESAGDVNANEALVEVPGLRLVQIDPNTIVPNPRQPRTHFDQEHLAELVHSVREFGVMQPVVVREVAGGYELIMGERRTRAAREAGLETIPAIVRETADENLLRDALLENLHRSQLNPLEEASAYQQLLDDFSITHEELAQRIGRSRPQISNTLRLLKLPVGVQQRVAAGVLSAGHARAILSLDDNESMTRLADKVVNEDLSVRAAEAAAKQIQASGGAATQRTAAPLPGARRAYLDDVASRLGDRLNTRVKVALGARKGQMSIEFASVQDLNRILQELGETDFGQS